MAFIGRLHPLLIHFPIAPVIAGALADGAAMVTSNDRWRAVARSNVRAGAVFAVLATIAGWCLALAPDTGTSPLLEWHQWLGTFAAGATFAAALATSEARGSASETRVYRVALYATGTLVAIPDISEDRLFGARTFCAPEGGTCGTDG